MLDIQAQAEAQQLLQNAAFRPDRHHSPTTLDIHFLSCEFFRIHGLENMDKRAGQQLTGPHVTGPFLLKIGEGTSVSDFSAFHIAT